VRLHRATEREPYTGLKPAGTDPGPIVKSADLALDGGSGEALVKILTDHIDRGVRERFHVAAEKKKHAGESVEAGRAYVATYVESSCIMQRSSIMMPWGMDLTMSRRPDPRLKVAIIIERRLI
jgi:hypothetical protein